MKKSLVLFIVMNLLFINVSMAMGFNDEPRLGKWVYENFILLKESGLLKGYPDNSFRGDRSATRYEMVELTGRVLKYLEDKIEVSGEDKTYLDEETVKEIISDEIYREEQTDDVYKAIKSLEKEFKDELAEQELRITTLEDDMSTLKSKVADLEKDVDRSRLMAIAGIIAGLIGIIK